MYVCTYIRGEGGVSERWGGGEGGGGGEVEGVSLSKCSYIILALHVAIA